MTMDGSCRSVQTGSDLSMYLDDGKPALEARLYDIVGITVNGKGDIILSTRAAIVCAKLITRPGLSRPLPGCAGMAMTETASRRSERCCMRLKPSCSINRITLYISDTMNHRVRKVDADTGLITTVAGNGDSGYEDKNMGGCGAARFVAKESPGT